MSKQTKQSQIDPLNVAQKSPAAKHSEGFGLGKNSENISQHLDRTFGMSKQNTNVVNDALNKSTIPQGQAPTKKAAK
jgi:hypothetical protein